MMILIKLCGFLLLSIILGFICTVLYIKFCAVVANYINRRYGDRLRKLFPKHSPNVKERNEIKNATDDD